MLHTFLCAPLKKAAERKYSISINHIWLMEFIKKDAEKGFKN